MTPQNEQQADSFLRVSTSAGNALVLVLASLFSPVVVLFFVCLLHSLTLPPSPSPYLNCPPLPLLPSPPSPSSARGAFKHRSRGTLLHTFPPLPLFFFPFPLPPPPTLPFHPPSPIFAVSRHCTFFSSSYEQRAVVSVAVPFHPFFFVL